MTDLDELNASGYLNVVAEARAQTASARWAEAAALWEQVTARNPVHGNHWAALAEAYFALDDFGRALPAYERAEELGVWEVRLTDGLWPGEFAYRIACCHAALGAGEQAAAALGRALRQGFRDLDRPRGDKLWEALRADAAVREMLGIIDTGLSRDEGWRADVAFLSREIRRRSAAFASVSEPDFAAAVSRLIRAVPDLSEAQIIAGLMKLLVPLGDGHAFIAPAAGNRELNRNLPVKFYLFPEGLFVTAALPRYRQLVGAQVLRVGAHPAADVLAALDPLISRDNPQQLAWLGPEVLPWPPMLHALGLIDDPAVVILTVRFADGSVGPVTVESVAAPVPREYPTDAPAADPTRPRPAGWVSLPDTLTPPLPLYLRDPDLLYWFEDLPDRRLVYFQCNGVGDLPGEPFAAFCDRLFGFIDDHPDRSLVIDLRWNGGGNTFIAQTLLHHLIGCANVRRRGGLFVIIGRGTFSAAQNTATAIQRETDAIFVGEPSGSRPNFVGETAPFELPYSKTIANVSDLYWQTSWPTDRRLWIAPDLYAPPALEAFRQNRDPALEAILACHGQALASSADD
jgi:tetratricopeptide (TPR) repeat protein